MKIEVGKRYAARNGKIIQIDYKDDSRFNPLFHSNEYPDVIWNVRGTVALESSEFRQNSFDLVREIFSFEGNPLVGLQGTNQNPFSKDDVIYIIEKSILFTKDARNETMMNDDYTREFKLKYADMADEFIKFLNSKK